MSTTQTAPQVKTFRVHVVASMNTHVTVEATNSEEARELASEMLDFTQVHTHESFICEAFDAEEVIVKNP
ncbi:hypothetical protein [Microcystis phage Mvi-JY20]|uniref:Uncharacterized protein n=1 Tax=Microcystis phage Mvi-JY20 TaxID=3128146 RepID=A0AAX4QG50_9CAUD